MRHGFVKYFVGGIVSGALAMSTVACDKKAESGAAAEGTAAAAPDNSAGGLGEAAGKVYHEAMKSLVAALEAKPEAADAKAKTVAILEGAQKQLIELGKKREAMSAEDKAAFDKKLAAALTGMDSATFNKYSDIASHYRKADREVGNLIGEANVLTQYANFDLLKKQAPAEAEKYGIK